MTNTGTLAILLEAATHSLVPLLSLTLPLVLAPIALSSQVNILTIPRPAQNALVVSNRTLRLASPSTVMFSSKANSLSSMAPAPRAWVLPPSQHRFFTLPVIPKGHRAVGVI